jgi:hypothetical protein
LEGKGLNNLIATWWTNLLEHFWLRKRLYMVLKLSGIILRIDNGVKMTSDIFQIYAEISVRTALALIVSGNNGFRPVEISFGLRSWPKILLKS